MTGKSGIRVWSGQYFEGKQIKRGTLIKEFLYKLFLIKSFFLSKSELDQDLWNSLNCQPDKVTY